MKKYGSGYACNLDNVFINYKHGRSLFKYSHLKSERNALIKRIFNEGVAQIFDDIIENNDEFRLPEYLGRKASIHLEPVTGEQFERDIHFAKNDTLDFLESNFTSYSLNMYVSTRSRLFTYRKYPITMSRYWFEKLNKNVNNGKVYG